MANISITEIQGYDSISSSRLTINDNFNIISDSINSVLGVLNVETGAFDLSALSSGSLQAKTLNITSQASISGSLNVTGNTTVTGDLQVGGKVKTSNILLGSTSSILPDSNGGLNLYGATGTSSISTKVTGTFDYVVLPKVSSLTTLLALQNPHVGTLAYSIGGTALYLCISTSSTPGATGTWVKVSTTSI